MKPEAQRIAIAEACGEIKNLCQRLGIEGGGGFDSKFLFENISDYPNDLNAMHEAEKGLTNEQRTCFVQELTELTAFDADANSANEIDWGFAHATAAQRAEAFLRAIGKWEDSSPQ